MESRGVSVLALLAGLVVAVLMSGSAHAAQCGKAAWYDLSGQTASGERSDGSALAAAHRTLPFGTRVRVENLSNGREVVVRVNDRGPFVGGRVIDVTRAAAEALGMIRSGTANVRVSVVDSKAKLDSSCKDPAPRVVTAEAVANETAATSPEPEPEATPTVPASEPEVAGVADAAESPVAAEDPGTAAAIPSPNESKTAVRSSGKVLVATVQYDEGTDESRSARPAPRASGSDAASFTEEPQVDDLEDARAVATAIDIPLPRPRPPVFGNAAPAFNRTLALRFGDAFAPGDPELELNVPLGYAPTESAPTEPRGAVITE